jgi:pyrroloquinoline quinone biosynthesis protein B
MLHAVVLGAAAGGGFPQWNSNAPACRRARAGDVAAQPRTQASIAVSTDEREWFLFNASPDLRWQIEATPALHPRDGLRSSPIAGVILAGADVDAIAGLLHLRERHRFTVYAPRPVLDVMAANPVFRVLSSEYVSRVELPLDDTTIALGGAAEASGLTVRAFPVPGKVPLYLEDAGDDPGVSEAGDAVGLEIIDRSTGGSFFFIPGCAAITQALGRRLAGAALVFFDGTLWRDDEMIRAGIGEKTGRRMGHISMSGEEGAIAAFRNLGVRRRIFIHINNSNPVLLDDTAERRAAEAAGWEIGYDGLEVRL